MLNPRGGSGRSSGRSSFTTGKSEADELPIVHLAGDSIFSCATCATHIAHADAIISKSFNGRHGRAILFSRCVNVITGPCENRNLMTGLHTVADTYCAGCCSSLGWKYVQAFEEDQKYKEGKFIVEKSRTIQEVGWR
mmetsp:Transcript_18984/g.48951  ORF Transcript_18984/g.48951 Transcript_18984/m.48951 type:complete len:137 (+) Transcript_18984:33-443(+)